MSKLLRAENSRELVKYVGTLSAKNIYTSQKEADEIVIALEYLRKQHKELSAVKGLKGKKLQALKKDIHFCELNGKSLKAQLEKLDPVQKIREIALQDEDDLIADLTLLILDLDKAFNINKGLSVSQVEHLSTSIMQRMGSFTLEDIALCFHRAKCGDYGQVYDRLDLNVVNTWLNQYKNERRELHQMDHQNKHLASKEGMSYSVKDSASVNRVAQDRGINTGDESHYKEFRAEFLENRLKTEKKDANTNGK